MMMYMVLKKDRLGGDTGIHLVFQVLLARKEVEGIQVIQVMLSIMLSKEKRVALDGQGLMDTKGQEDRQGILDQEEIMDHLD